MDTNPADGVALAMPTQQEAIDALFDGHVLLWESLNGVPVQELGAREIHAGISCLAGLGSLSCWDRSISEAMRGCELKISEPWDGKGGEALPFEIQLDQVHAQRLMLINTIASSQEWKPEKWQPYLMHSIALDQAFYACLMPLDYNTEPGFTCTARQVVQYGLETARRSFIRRLLRLRASRWMENSTTSEWCLKDILGHLADWDIYNASMIQSFSRVGQGDWEITKTGFDAWNQAHAEIRRNHTWGHVLSDFCCAYQNIYNISTSLPLNALYQRNFQAPAGWREYPYGWLTMTSRHYREHYPILDNWKAPSIQPDVIIADNPDEPYLTELIAALAGYGMQTLLVPMLETALEIGLFQQDVAWVIELGLPDGDGVVCFNRVLAATPEVPILILTRLGYDRRHWLMQNLSKGNCRLLYKPANPRKIVETVLKMKLGRDL
jgi:ActR/RegA family two-component response regulator